MQLVIGSISGVLLDMAEWILVNVHVGLSLPEPFPLQCVRLGDFKTLQNASCPHHALGCSRWAVGARSRAPKSSESQVQLQSTSGRAGCQAPCHLSKAYTTFNAHGSEENAMPEAAHKLPKAPERSQHTRKVAARAFKTSDQRTNRPVPELQT